MPESANASRDIDARARSLRELLAGRKYSIDYYQRDYKWQQKQVRELLDDLTGVFLDSHTPDDERTRIAEYRNYFLGSIIVSDKNGVKFIIDGQQRLTTLTLLLVFIHHGLTDEDQKRQVSELIFSSKYGRRSFNLDVPERITCMEALLRGADPIATDVPESVATILARFDDIRDLFPGELLGPTLAYFTDWVMENVQLVEITAYSDSDAYRIFETMNDRGLSLTPADMLKGYLLANIPDVDDRNRASDAWKRQVRGLSELGKDEDADAVKAWLRSQHAQDIRERSRGAEPKDFDLIGTEFHRWVRTHQDTLGLLDGAAFRDFILTDFAFYGAWYRRLREAALTPAPGLEAVHFNAQNNLTLQYPVLLAPLRPGDPEEVSLRKIRVAAAFLDILVYRRIWNWRAIDYSTLQYAMFLVMKDIRLCSVEEVASRLRRRLDSESEDFRANERFHLHGNNGPQVHRVLARLTDYVETESGQTSRYAEYSKRGVGGYEIEHIWADHPDRHTDEFEHPADFAEYRNRLGDLLLLPKSFNASYGDLTYGEKRGHYFGQNLLAQSLHERAYQNNPGFAGFIERTGLAFRPHEEFRRADLDVRQALYQQLAELVWDPERRFAQAMS